MNQQILLHCASTATSKGTGRRNMSFARKLKRKAQNKRKHSTEDDKMIRKRYELLINYQDPFLNKMIRPIEGKHD